MSQKLGAPAKARMAMARAKETPRLSLLLYKT